MLTVFCSPVGLGFQPDLHLLLPLEAGSDARLDPTILGPFLSQQWFIVLYNQQNQSILHSIQLVKEPCAHQNNLFRLTHALSNRRQTQTIVELFCSGVALSVSPAAFQWTGKQHYDSLLEFKKQTSISRVTFMIHENDHSIQLSCYTGKRNNQSAWELYIYADAFVLKRNNIQASEV